MSASAGRAARHGLGFAVLVAALAAWEAWARTHPSFLLPSASVVGRRAWEIWPRAAFLRAVAASLTRLAAGLALGACVGIGLGLLMGSSARARRTLEPLTELLRATPVIAVVPAAVVVLGLGDAMRIGVIAFGVCFPVLVNTLDGVRAVPPETRDTAALLGLRPLERALRVTLPAALPSIVAGLRLAVSLGLVLVVVSEFAGGGDGLGRQILLRQSEFDVPALYGGILFLGLLGYVLNRLFLAAESRLLAWHYGAAGESLR